MPTWDSAYLQSLTERFGKILEGLTSRLQAVAEGRTAPGLEDLAIGSARKQRAAVLFFDIRSFSLRTGSPLDADLRNSLLLVDCVLPIMMHLVYDHGGYVEKNTGDGIMALFGVDGDDVSAANDALGVATAMFYVLENLVNPVLVKVGIAAVRARIGIDFGPVLISRVGVPTGSSKHVRNFLAAVGPAANLACHLQEMAGTNEIWVGDLIRRNAFDWRQRFFVETTPPGWHWNYVGQPWVPYRLWRYYAVKIAPATC